MSQRLVRGADAQAARPSLNRTPHCWRQPAEYGSRPLVRGADAQPARPSLNRTPNCWRRPAEYGSRPLWYAAPKPCQPACLSPIYRGKVRLRINGRR